MAKKPLVPSLVRIAKQTEQLKLLFRQDTSTPKRLDWMIDMARLLGQVFKKVDTDVLLGVMRGVFNKPRTDPEKAYLARFLAANERALREGVIAIPGFTPEMGKPHWCHWRIKSVSRKNQETGKHEVKLEGQSGYVAMTVISEFWSAGRCAFAARECGFSRSFGKLPYRRPDHLHGMLFIANSQTVIHNGRKTIRLEDRRCNSSSLKYNQDVIALRLRVGASCPRGYDFECHQCVVGLDQCPGGCRPRTLESVVCPTCNQQGWRDPGNGEIQGCGC